MRKFPGFMMLGLCFIAMPAFAGEMTQSKGQTIWLSTKCSAPVIPAVLKAVDSEAAANDVNLRVTQYNEYVARVQVYMDCLSAEAQADATRISTDIINAAQKEIEDVNANAIALGASFKRQ